jgi:hypothetical protein
MTGLEAKFKQKIVRRDDRIKRKKATILALQKENIELREKNAIEFDVKFKKQRASLAFMGSENVELHSKIEELTKSTKFLRTSLFAAKQEIENLRTKKVPVLDVEDEKALAMGRRRVYINNETVERAFKNLRRGKSLFKMIPRTHMLIRQAGRWDSAIEIHRRFNICNV